MTALQPVLVVVLVALVVLVLFCRFLLSQEKKGGQVLHSRAQELTLEMENGVIG